MKILHVCSHLGGGLGTVILDWMDHLPKDSDHSVMCLDYANDKATTRLHHIPLVWNMAKTPNLLRSQIAQADIVLCHYYDHPMLADLFADPIPDCRLVFWCHKRVEYSPAEIAYPDLWLDTSPVQGHGRHIWSCGDITRFLEIQPKAHSGFNIGYVGTCDYKKIHPNFFDMCLQITASIPGVRFTVVGENHLPKGPWDRMITYTGKVDDVAPYLAELNVFGYPLRPDHTGTCEQVLGECMAAGVVPVVMDNPAELKIVRNRWDGFIASGEKEYIDIIQYLYGWNGDLIISKNELIENARFRAKELYNIDTMIQEWNSVFEELMQKPKSSHGGLNGKV